MKKKDILKNTGNLLRIRQHIYLQEENLIDPPEMFWSNASLEIWFKEMARALDVDLRMRNLKTKVDYSLELQNTLLELNSTVCVDSFLCLDMKQMLISLHASTESIA